MANANRGIKKSNNGLPNRWAEKHGAIYYRPREDEVRFWGKRWYRLGVTYKEAEKTYFDKLDEIADQEGVKCRTVKQITQITKRGIAVRGPLIYFLISGREIVYVGKSTAFSSRIFDHKGKEFESLATIACSPSDLDAMEIAYIAKLRPKYNIRNVKEGTSELYFGSGV